MNLQKFRFIGAFLGVCVSWYATITNFIAFYNIEGTIFKIKDCVLPNPIVTPCFWGAVAFIVTLYFSYKLLKKHNPKHEKYLHKRLFLRLLFADDFSTLKKSLKICTFSLKNILLIFHCRMGKFSPSKICIIFNSGYNRIYKLFFTIIYHIIISHEKLSQTFYR